jgi:protease-4
MSNGKVSFGKIFWPSLVAIIVASFISIIIFFLALGGFIGSISAGFQPKPMQVKQATVLHLTLNNTISEVSDANINPLAMEVNYSNGLNDLLLGIEKAKTDGNIKGIFIELGELNCGYASLLELRGALKAFKNSGKFIVAYHSGEVITQKEYFLASVANENYGFPSSMMEFVGLGTEIMYFKNLFDKFGIEMQVVRGRNNAFKSAVEPYFRENMSDSSRLQVERYLSSIWGDLLQLVSQERNVSVAQLNAIADSTLIRRAEDAVKYHLMDGVMYQDEVLAKIKAHLKLPATAQLNLFDFEKYARKKSEQLQVLDETKSPNIAVVFAEGAISEGGSDGISSEKLVKQIRKARENKTIKAIVLRVNSPGGSALASEEIWREVILAKQHKKVIVSMGDVAASGGYFISAAADRIFAEPTTITGSIGVFGVIPYTGKFLNETIGLSFDRAGTNQHAVLSTNRKLSSEELATVQDEVNEIYGKFLQIVADGRHLDTARVNEIARGRVWTGRDALQIGLVDELGGLNTAIAYAQKIAAIKTPVFKYYPGFENAKWVNLIQNLKDEQDNENVRIKVPQWSQKALNILQKINEIESMQGIQMRMPYYLEIH